MAGIFDYIFDVDFSDPSNTGLLEDIFGFAKKTIGNPDLQGLLSLGGGIIGNYLGGDSKSAPVGYQGGIPQYTVDRQQLDYNDPERRPGSAGRRYFTDTTFTEIPQNTSTTSDTTSSSPANLLGLTDEQLQGLYQEYLNANQAAEAESDTTNMAAGGLAGLAKGKYLNGATDGMADKIPARINGVQEARLSDGEFVVPADVVSHIGNGNSDAGAKELYAMMDRIRHARTGRKAQGKEISPRKYMPK